MKFYLSFLYISLFLFQAAGQPVTELNETDVFFSPTLTIPGKLRAIRTKDSTLLPAGYYKTSGENRYHLFEVSDSGFLTGSFKDFYENALYMEKIWDDGLVKREYFIIKGKIVSESFDSTVSVLLYNSKKKIWMPQLKSVTIEKEYSTLGRLQKIRYTKGPYDAYARYEYKYGILVSEIIPHYLEKKMDPSGNLVSLVQFNWTLKQIETSTYRKEILVSKSILKNPTTVWDPKGIVLFTDVPGRYNETLTTSYYDGKKIKKKEVEKYGNRTVTEYDLNGKITSKQTYKTELPSMEQDVVRPVEEKQ